MQKVKNRLEIITGVKVKVYGNTIKAHVKELDGTDIYMLNAFNLVGLGDLVENVSIKRSGTGLTIIVTAKK